MTIVGVRPEFVQTKTVSEAIRRQGHSEVLVHTGQHYDFNMSEVFFKDLDLPRPSVHLEVGSGTHAEQTAQIMIRLEETILRQRPDWVLVYGDTNSTIAGALVAAKLQIPLAHVEAGLRSFDRTMPEEINRVVTDHLSNLLFAPTQVAADNLRREGITEGVQLVGDVRVDLILGLVEKAKRQQPALFQQIKLSAGEPFALTTIHRAVNTDNLSNLQDIVAALNKLEIPVVLPIHPRLRKMLDVFKLTFEDNVHAIPPVGIVDMVALLDACQIVITDSGGLQKEAYMLRRPTVTVRDTTEWTETVDSGWNRLCPTLPDAIHAAVAEARQAPPADHPDFYGAYGVSERICEALQTYTARQPAPVVS
ncbi:MAG: UDP-N-acetylglucosamine 2-epimerase (non-hydrolyzing) [Chloroflexi bacterium]|nr:UDP-N-acetylglucosamine 2-epimerase (non-hydrolyzing) [Chloroflexota bacterium]